MPWRAGPGPAMENVVKLITQCRFLGSGQYMVRIGNTAMAAQN